jgi:type IV secretion system protein VirB6
MPLKVLPTPALSPLISSLLDKASVGANANNIITLAAQCCLAGIGSGFVVWLWAKIVGSLAGVNVQGTAKMGLMA